MTHQDEQKLLIKHYFEEHHFTDWKPILKYDNNLKKEVVSTVSGFDTPLELIVSSVCNTKCSYCYYKNFEHLIYPKDIQNSKQIVNNCEKLLKWINLNDYYPRKIEIFSGEFFNLPYYKDILELIRTYIKPFNNSSVDITIPTNCTFCLSDKKVDEIQSVLDDFNKPGSKHFIGLSMSMDGKYLDNETRALKNGKKYDDDYYDRAFKFAKRNRCGFHPMIGAKGIDKWCDNIDWYVENIMKYNGCSELEAMLMIYLLEVRNPDWTNEELNLLDKFIHHYTQKGFKACHEDSELFFQIFILNHRSNLYSQVFGSIPRGLGCSIQSVLPVRLGDLSVPLCHRTAYDGFLAGKFKFDEEKWDFEPENPNLYMLVNSFDSSNSPKCCDCPINEICNKYCIGCNYEVNKDFFTPVDTVCDLALTKTVSLLTNLKEIGVLDLILKKLTNNNYIDKKANQIIELCKFLNIYEEK